MKTTVKPAQRQAKRRAFTLIEMILAIGIASIVLITITTVLFSTLRLRQATEDMVDGASPIDQATAYIKRDLECVMTPTNGTSKIMSGCFRIGNLSSAGVSGNVVAEMYTATGALSSKAPWGDVQRVTYELKDATAGGGGQNLYRSVMRNLLAVATPNVTDQLMLGGVASVKFSAYDGTQWDDAWDTSDVTSLYTNLPVAVKVEITLASQNNATLDPITLVVPIDETARTNAAVTYSSAGATGGGGTTPTPPTPAKKN
jgi:type II secretion system protein J